MYNHRLATLPVGLFVSDTQLSCLLLLLFLSSSMCAAQVYTRGVGVYPGDPREYVGPSMQIDANTYRNLALHRPAYQSSAYDYNLTHS